MFDLDKWQEIFSTIRKHKLRTLLTALGVWWGIFMLIVLMGAGTGLQNGVFAIFGGHAKNAMYIWTQKTTKPYAGYQPGRRIPLSNSDMEAIEQNFGEAIEYLAPRLWVNAGEITRGDKKGSFDVRGDKPDLIHIDAIEVSKGRFLNDLDIKEYRKVIVIGKRVSEVLFGEEDPIGEYIKINGADYLVVGEFQSNRGEAEDASDDEQTILMPLSTAQRVTNSPERIGWFVCTIDKNYSTYVYEDRIKELLRTRHKIHPEDERAIGSNNVEEEFKEIQNLFIGIKIIVWIVGIGSLLAGIVGVSNIMLIVVKERTKEIGIRKALGATPGSIISLILLESVFITTSAGYLGLLSSVMVVYGLKVAAGTGVSMFTNPQINMGVGIGALLLLVIAGAVAGLIPALTAARINPVVALRDE